jgi:hypothetical protein
MAAAWVINPNTLGSKRVYSGFYLENAAESATFPPSTSKKLPKLQAF